MARLSREYGMSEDSISNHKKKHLPRQLAAWNGVKQRQEAVNVLNELQNLMESTREILTEARERNHNALALAAIKEFRGSLETIAKIEYAAHELKLKGLGITPEEVEEFQEWKASQAAIEAELTVDELNQFTPEEKDVLFKMNAIKLARPRMRRTK